MPMWKKYEKDNNIWFEWEGWDGVQIIQGTKYGNPLDFMNVKNYASLMQIHSSIVQIVDTSVQFVGDGLIAKEKNLYLLIKVADCLPAFIFVPDIPLVGIIHIGWKGLVSRIIQEAVETIKKIYNIPAEKVKVILGPSILPENYPVGKPVISLAKGKISSNALFRKGNRYYMDLRKGAIEIFEKMGVKEIIDSKKITQSPEIFFSKRGGDKGRNLSLIRLIKV